MSLKPGVGLCGSLGLAQSVMVLGKNILPPQSLPRPVCGSLGPALSVMALGRNKLSPWSPGQSAPVAYVLMPIMKSS